jgi:hypothetical protein
MWIYNFLVLCSLVSHIWAMQDGLLHEKNRCLLYGMKQMDNNTVTYVSNIEPQPVSFYHKGVLYVGMSRFDTQLALLVVSINAKHFIIYMWLGF